MNGYSHIPIRGISVDPRRAQDIDDTIWVEKTKGGWCVTVCIADVAKYVEKGSPQDVEALEKAFSQYTDHQLTCAMLDKDLTFSTLSLTPGSPHHVVAFLITLSQDLALTNIEVRRTTLTSEAKLFYGEVNTILNNSADTNYQFWTDAYELASKLVIRRSRRGADAFFDTPWGSMSNEGTYVLKISPGDSYSSYLIVQELMILTNHLVSTLMSVHEVPMLYRNCVSGQDELDRLYTDHIHGHLDSTSPECMRKLCVSLKEAGMRARYDPKNLSHFPLHLPVYGHWTSPIRRYADIVNHRQLLAHITGESLPYTEEELKEIARRINHQREIQRIRERERFLAVPGTTGGFLQPAPHVPTEPRFMSSKPLLKVKMSQKKSGQAEHILTEEDKLSLADIVNTLFGDALDSKREEVLRYIQNKLPWALEILKRAHEKYDTPAIEDISFDIHDVAKGNNRAVASVRYKNRELIAVAHGPKTEEAKRLSVLLIIRQLAEVSTPAGEGYPLKVKAHDMTAGKASPKQSKISHASPVDKLTAWCLKHGVDQPQYRLSMKAGKSLCECILVFDGKRQIWKGEGVSKKVAKEYAARVALKTLMRDEP